MALHSTSVNEILPTVLSSLFLFEKNYVRTLYLLESAPMWVVGIKKVILLLDYCWFRGKGIIVRWSPWGPIRKLMYSQLPSRSHEGHINFGGTSPSMTIRSIIGTLWMFLHPFSCVNRNLSLKIPDSYTNSMIYIPKRFTFLLRMF